MPGRWVTSLVGDVTSPGGKVASLSGDVTPLGSQVTSPAGMPRVGAFLKFDLGIARITPHLKMGMGMENQLSIFCSLILTPAVSRLEDVADGAQSYAESIPQDAKLRQIQLFLGRARRYDKFDYSNRAVTTK